MKKYAAAGSLALALLGGCIAPQEATTVTGPDGLVSPPIFSGPKVNGRGVPNGRSDGTDPYLKLTARAADAGYGSSPQNPIKVGGGPQSGPLRAIGFVNSLRSPKGEVIEYERLGACCAAQGPDGAHMLEVYRLTAPGQAAQTLLYFNTAETGPLQIPVGFAARPAAEPTAAPAKPSAK